MVKIIYLIIAVLCSFLSLAFVGYGVIHGATWLALIFPITLGIFFLPLYVHKRLRNNHPRLATLFFLFPLILVVFPVAYFFILNPMMEKRVATKVLSAMQIEPLGEEILYTPSGAIIGVKFVYDILVPPNIESLLTLQGMEYYNLPLPELSVADGTYYGLIQQNFLQITKDGIKKEPYERLTPGRYHVESWLVGNYAKFLNGSFCRSAYYEQYGANEKSYLLENVPAFVSFSSRVDLSYRMGIFYFPHLTNHPLNTKLSGGSMRNTVASLPVCTSEYL